LSRDPCVFTIAGRTLAQFSIPFNHLNDFMWLGRKQNHSREQHSTTTAAAAATAHNSQEEW
jgi:hypothetical protein